MYFMLSTDEVSNRDTFKNIYIMRFSTVLPGSSALVHRSKTKKQKTLSAEKDSGELYVSDSSVREFLFFLVLIR